MIMNWLKSALSLALLLLISNNWTSLVSCQSANGKNDDYSTISYVQESMLRLLYFNAS